MYINIIQALIFIWDITFHTLLLSTVDPYYTVGVAQAYFISPYNHCGTLSPVHIIALLESHYILET